MKKTLNIILFGRKKSYFVKCTLTLIGLYLGVLFWYFNVDYLGQPIQNALVLAVCSLICISVLVALYRIPEQLCVNSQIEKLLYFPVNPTNIIYMVIIRLFKIQILSFICCFLSSIYFFKWNVLPLILTTILCALILIIIDLFIFSISIVISTVSEKYCGYILLTFQYGGFLFIMWGIVRLLIFAFEKPLMINGIYHLFENNYLISVLIFIMIIFLSYIYTIKISASYFLRCYHYLNCFTKPRFHANISKYFNKNPYILNEWCRVSRNKELLFYSNLKSVITVYLLVNLFSKRISGSYIEIQSVLKILVMVLCCAMNTISSTSYTSDKNISYYNLFPVKNSRIFFSKVLISSVLNEIVIICAWIVCSIGKNGLFFDISLLLYGTFTNILCSFMGVYFDYKMPRTEITPNTLLHGNMSKIFVLVMIVALTILEMYFGKKFSFVKFSVNGIGKSTFLNSIIQPSTLDKGSVKIDDIPSTDFTAKYHYAFVPDTKDMFLNLTGKEYLQFVSELYNQKEKFDELLAIYIPKLKLENSLEQTISSYSLGMKQKIYLAGAFMSNAQNIILDEPFNAIDPESTSIIKKILFDLKDTGKMILFSVHNLDLVSNFCDKIIFIDNRHMISAY